jgi:pyridoxamine 5'-phosphate oxidase
MKERSELLKKIENLKKKYKNKQNVPRPPHWSGWCLSPSSIEFWLHRDNRIHERLRYNKTVNGWEKEILYP